MAVNVSFDDFILFDRLVTGVQNKLSQFLIAHYCSYLSVLVDVYTFNILYRALS